MTSQVWFPAYDAPGYEVTEWGRVRSLDRVIQRGNGRPQSCPGKELKPDTTPYGYQRVNLAGRSALVHVLVISTFIEPKPFVDAQVRHLNGKSSDNWVGNLAWGTPWENSQDSMKHGVLTKDVCTRDHRLAGPNLKLNAAGHKVCRSCEYARKFISQRNIRGKRLVSKSELRGIADVHYARLDMGGVR